MIEVNDKELNVRARRDTLAALITFAAFVVVAVVGLVGYILIRPHFSSTIVQQPPEEVLVGLHLPLPSEVRGIYITAATAGNLERYKALIDSVRGRGINAVVVDLKDPDGSLSFAPNADTLKAEAVAHPTIRDLDALVSVTHEADMYLIARISVFQDPAYAQKHPSYALQRADGSLWRDRRGLAWVDPAAVESWKYNAAISREAYARGFDEIQFDYIRFATDGNLGAIRYPIFNAKEESFRDVIGRFFTYLNHELRSEGIPLSADLFGFTTWHQSDLGIGQWLADGLTHTDFISPMVYPSHYPSGTLGFTQPAAHPYEIVHDSMAKANEVVAQLHAADSTAHVGALRPWLQAFDLGAVYTPERVLAQVRAARENGNSGFLFWNAGNKYDSLPYLSTN